MLERIEIEAFLTLAEVLHFGRTAERLHLSPGRISQTIKALERRIGAPLFHRTSRSVRLTDVGQTLYTALRPAVDDLERAVTTATAAAHRQRTRLTVGFSTPWCGDLVIVAGDRLQEELPGCDVSIQEIQLSQPLQGLRSGEIDIQLSEFPINEPDLVAGPVIFTEPRALLVGTSDPLAACDSITLEDLAQTRLIPVRGNAPDYWQAYHYPAHTPSGRRIPHARPVTYWPETLSLVGAGRGSTIASLRAARYHPHPGVVYLPIEDADPIRYGLIWRADNRTEVLHRFAQIVVKAADV